MPPAGFEPAIPVGDRPHTHALDRSATGTSQFYTSLLRNTKFVNNLITTKININYP